MSRRGLVLAAHGSGDGSTTNQGVEELAARLGAELGFAAAAAAFHAGSPGYAEVLDHMGCDEVVVVPLFTSRGYYCDQVLPRRLARNRCFPAVRVSVRSPVGSHPALPGLAAARVRRVAAERGLASPAVALIGHGTRRNPRSRVTTEALARALTAHHGLTAEAFFLDDDPPVEEVPLRFRGRAVVVLPFLIGGGRHASRDVARRLGVEGDATAGSEPPAKAIPRWIVDRPLGSDPAIESLVAELASGAGGQPPTGERGTVPSVVVGNSTRK
ncbi:MAG: CbiX/SirB N-terminal domain-containing protein [Thermoanaerobaculia bacterium]|nr:CbiX/SirB N-terminal domain-containing protein [Thermoanaerobaculia bacterium]